MNQLPEETALSLPHRLSLENRQQLHLTGITEVESFDEAAVILHTAADTLIIRGEKACICAPWTAARSRSTVRSAPSSTRRRGAPVAAVLSRLLG